MNERTPTTEDVLSAYLYACHEHRRGGLIAEFNRWLEQVKAEAWNEGHSTSETSWDHIYSGHPVPEGELCPECSTGNPYRKAHA